MIRRFRLWLARLLVGPHGYVVDDELVARPVTTTTRAVGHIDASDFKIWFYPRNGKDA